VIDHFNNRPVSPPMALCRIPAGKNGPGLPPKGCNP